MGVRANRTYYAGRRRADDDVDCATCKDMAFRCKNCLRIDDECRCTTGPQLVPCPDCNIGTNSSLQK